MIKISGVKNVLQELDQKFKKNTENYKDKISNSLLNDLKKATPVDTGFARDSWKYTGKSIENTADYIDDLNRGTSTQAPTNFIEKTVLAHRDITPSGIIVRFK